jgi:hypothetical protein
MLRRMCALGLDVWTAVLPQEVTRRPVSKPGPDWLLVATVGGLAVFQAHAEVAAREDRSQDGQEARVSASTLALVDDPDERKRHEADPLRGWLFVARAGHRDHDQRGLGSSAGALPGQQPGQGQLVQHGGKCPRPRNGVWSARCWVEYAPAPLVTPFRLQRLGVGVAGG